MRLLLFAIVAFGSMRATALCHYSGPITPMVRDYFQTGLMVQISTSALTGVSQVDATDLAIDLYHTAVKNIETYDDAAFIQGILSSAAKAGRPVHFFISVYKAIDEVVKSKFPSRYDEYMKCSRQ